VHEHALRPRLLAGASVTKTVLHVGCGNSPLPEWLDGYSETRLDIDPGVQPDIVAPMIAMGDIGQFDALYTSHCLEHLYPDEVPTALGEIKRVLKPGGVALIVVPDLEGVEATDAVIFDSPAGPITGLDMIYGMGAFVAANRHMAHHCGFVQATLAEVVNAAGFARVHVERAGHNLVAAAVA
jgi:SAM-dependent methyltransferase